MNDDSRMNINLDTQTKFLLSTSGSSSALQRHNKALEKLGVNLRYFTFDRKISAEVYAGLLRSPIVRGGAVTGQGLKSSIIQHIDELDDLAQRLNSVNTVVNIDGKLHGYNTDAYGFETAISNFVNENSLKINSAVIYGNGGVSGVAAKVLKNMNIEVTMTGRNPENVTKKMQELDIKDFDGPYDLVVNATPISSEPVDQAVGLMDVLTDAKIVFDHSMPEMEDRTNYLKEYCASNNVEFIAGADMYIPQMIKQWGLFLKNVEDLSGDSTSVDENQIREAWNI